GLLVGETAQLVSRLEVRDGGRDQLGEDAEAPLRALGNGFGGARNSDDRSPDRAADQDRRADRCPEAGLPRDLRDPARAGGGVVPGRAVSWPCRGGGPARRPASMMLGPSSVQVVPAANGWSPAAPITVAVPSPSYLTIST